MIYNKEIYDPRTFTWDRWCELMAELFAANQLGTAPESQWREWANALSGIGRFTGAPSADGFATWQDWAQALNNAVRR